MGATDKRTLRHGETLVMRGDGEVRRRGVVSRWSRPTELLETDRERATRVVDEAVQALTEGIKAAQSIPAITLAEVERAVRRAGR